MADFSTHAICETVAVAAFFLRISGDDADVLHPWPHKRYQNVVNSLACHFLCAPSNATFCLAWNRAILRVDRELCAKSEVCDSHFHEQGILKCSVHVINVEVP